MSWRVQATGRPSAVAAAIEGQFVALGQCKEPEEGIKQGVRALLAKALLDYKPDSVVKVGAAGSQSGGTYTAGEWMGPYNNSISITLEPLYGWVE